VSCSDTSSEPLYGATVPYVDASSDASDAGVDADDGSTVDGD
jgi:hypothetical protein